MDELLHDRVEPQSAQASATADTFPLEEPALTATLERPVDSAPARAVRSVPSRLLLAVLSLASCVFWLSQPAYAITAPNRVEVHYVSSSAEVRWSSVADATSYAVEVSKDGYYGPWRRWTTSSAQTALSVPFSAHPYRDQQGAYRYRVFAINSGGSASRAVAMNKSQGSAVSTADRAKAASKANSCLKQGLAAGATTAGGAGIVAVAAAWVPGVNAVSAGAVATAVGSTAASTYVVCLLPW